MTTALTHTLTIAQTWDGQPLPASAQATLRLTLDADALRIDVDAPYQGDPPPDGPVGPTDGLWSYEVVELFVVADGDRYTEIELSPHGHHWVLRLEGIRQAVERGVSIEWTPRIEGDRYQGTAVIERRHLPSNPVTCNAFRIAGTGPERRFHAWTAVPGDKPDFHRLHQFGAWPF